MKRFLVREELSAGKRFRLSPEESKHATRVMRLKTGDHVLLSDGRGTEAEAELIDEEREGALIEVKSVRRAASRGFRVELLQGTLKGARMDWLVEKATELGVDAIRAVSTQFSVAGDRSDRWERVAHAALKQSGNPRAPELFEAAPLMDAVSGLANGYHGFLLSPVAREGLAAAVRAALGGAGGTVVLAVGPEGGFSPEEERFLREKGFRDCRLSAQILRGETAGIVAAAVALHALEFTGDAGL